MKIVDTICEKLGLFNDDDPKDTAEDADDVKETPKSESPKKDMPQPEPQKPDAQVKPAFEAVKPPSTSPHFGSKVVDFHAAIERRDNAMSMTSKSTIHTIKPKNFDDAQIVANCLRDRIPVIINFEQTDPNDAARIIDFISGTTYALNGDIKKVNDTVFICAPNNVHVSASDEEKKGAASMPWLSK